MAKSWGAFAGLCMFVAGTAVVSECDSTLFGCTRDPGETTNFMKKVSSYTDPDNNQPGLRRLPAPTPLLLVLQFP